MFPPGAWLVEISIRIKYGKDAKRCEVQLPPGGNYVVDIEGGMGRMGVKLFFYNPHNKVSLEKKYLVHSTHTSGDTGTCFGQKNLRL